MLWSDSTWEVINEKEKILGFLDSFSTKLYKVKGDDDLQFIQIIELYSDVNHVPLIQTDIVLPKISGESVNAIEVKSVKSGETSSQFENVISDRNKINEFFDAFYNGKKIDSSAVNIQEMDDNIYFLACYSADMPLKALFTISRIHNQYICKDRTRNGYIIIPDETLQALLLN